MGELYQGAGEHGKAITAYLSALDSWQALADEMRQAATLTGLAKAYAANEEADQAQDSYAAAAELLETLGDKAGLAGLWEELADFYRTQESYQEAGAAYGSGCRPVARGR